MNILVIGAHPDDQELAMGGAIARFVASGHNVVLLDLTDGEPTPMGSKEKRAKESAAAAQILGVRRVQAGLTNRRLEHTIEARHRVAGIIRSERVDVMFVPYFEDAHPDHRAATLIAEDARFDAKLTNIDLPGEPCYPKWLFHYYCTHLRIVPQPSFLIDTTGFTERKQQAIMAYQSQVIDNVKNRELPKWIAHADRYFGSRIGVETAEPFFSREPIGMRDLGALV